jgi:dihydroneopterin aldolase
MRFAALVGILPRAREAAQPIEIDLTVQVRDAPAGGDDIVDYRALYDITAAVFSLGHIEYLEQIGERVAGAALASSGRIASARVAVRKPAVMLGGPLGYAEVVIERQADA